MTFTRLDHSQHHRGIMFTIFFAVSTMATMPVTASYLDELEREATRSFEAPKSETTERPASPPAGSQTSPTVVNTMEDRLEPGLSKEGFEEALQHNFYGSYLFYSRLSAADQEAVYQEYTQNNNIDHLREVIKQRIK